MMQDCSNTDSTQAGKEVARVDSVANGDASLRILIDACADAVLIIDLQGILRFVNPAGRELFGRPADQLIGQAFGFPAVAGETVEIQILRSTGEAVSAEMRVVETVWENATALLATLRETTRRRLAEQAVRAQNAELERCIAERTAQLEAANRAKDDFIAVLSHELRTPLTPVLLSVASLVETPGLPAEVVDDLRMIHRNIELEARLIDDLLDLTRIARGKLSLRLGTVDAHDCLRNALEICRNDIHAKQISLRQRLDATASFIEADAARLQQVFWNLIKNAIKFTDLGGNITIRSTNTADGKFRVEVMDSGIGIDSEVLPRIFKPFEQGHSSITRQFGGLGLGLAVSKAIVEAHNGQIFVHSEGRNRGSRFTIQWPTVGVAQAKPDAAPNKPRRMNRPSKLLLVEDDETTRRVLARLLRRSGYEVKTASTVAGALEFMQQEEIHFVISDLGLPDGTGHDLMAQMKALNSQIVGIALSGYGMEQDIRRSLEAGFVAHLTKPLDIPKLQAAIDSVLLL